MNHIGNVRDRILYVTPSVLRNVGRGLEVDVGFAESLELCLEYFEHVTVACPVTSDISDSGLRTCRPAKDLPLKDRITFIELPYAYDLLGFVRNYRAVSQTLKTEIEKADYLLFSPHTLIGDWPTVAVREARKLERPYVLEADVVYEEVAQIGWVRDAPWKRFIKKSVLLPLFRQSHRYCVKHSDLALCQEQDVYDAYSPFASNPQKISSNIAISLDDRISDAQLQRKLDGIDQNRPLKLCYVGRAIDMKGPNDWLNTVHELIKRGVQVKASWLGDGSLLPSMRSKAEALGIAGQVNLPGFVSREEKIETVKESDIFLFCHKTREAPRALGEALACGCPLVGYGSAYPKDLVAQSGGGGEFAELGDWKKLADIVQDLDNNRSRLRELIRLASNWGRLYDWHTHLRRRAVLIKKTNLTATETAFARSTG